MTVTLRDGRSVTIRDLGARDGVPLVALHGTPGSRVKFVTADAVARRHGIRLIAPDRWGYGGTSPHPRPSLTAYADDMAEVADLLGIGRFAIFGVSGGGPYAAAVASVLGDRITALALAAPVGPIAGEDDAEITPFHRFCFGPIARRPATVGAVFHAFRAMLDVSPVIGMRMAMLRIAAVDRRVLGRRDVARHLSQTFVEGLRPGVAGPVVDMQLFGTPWDVDLARCAAPARLWLGSADRNVPCSAARRLATRLPGCELVEIAGEGHLWIADNYDAVLEWVAGVAASG
ncbi:MAG: alpha/beta fold hydrolase [Hyphomicrobiaceae bacterium]